MENKMKTDDQYIKSPNNCPHCDSKNISNFGKPQSDDSFVTIEVECHDCGKCWNDLYKLIGIVR